jgi:predicted ABC-type ATPase
VQSPLLVVLAGPNGAGKSTFYIRYLAETGYPFLNADRIALEEFGPEAAAKAREAAKLADAARINFVRQRQSFIFETVLSDPVGDKVGFFQQARNMGYHLQVHFIGLASSNLSQARVVHRVALGGHDVPDDKLRERYPRTLDNLVRLLDVADELFIYDNSSVQFPHRLVARLERGLLLKIAAPFPPGSRPSRWRTGGRRRLP